MDASEVRNTDGVPDVRSSPAPIVSGDPVEVAQDVYVIADRRVELVPNVGIVLGTSAALVVDSGLGPRNGAHVLEQARRVAGDRRLYLTVTHFHPEHGFGAQAFKGAATIIYNAGQREELARKGATYLEMFSGLSDAVAAELSDVEFVDPDVVYDREATIDLGERSVTLRAVGPAHTGSDQLVLVGGDVVFCGDLCEARIFPIAPYFPPFDADLDGDRWIQVLDEIAAATPTVVVPGHGAVGDASLLAGVRDFLIWVREEATRLRAAGVTADDTAATIDQAARRRWDTWERPEWIGYAARAFYDAAA